MSEQIGNIARQINEKIGILAVINQYLSLKRKGKDYVSLCPFHDDTHPSLLVSEKKQIFKCFSCNTGGGAIKFVMLYENVNYQKALQKIVEQHKVEIDNFTWENQKRNPQEEKMLEIFQEIHNFYKLQILNPSLNVRKYLNQRKMSKLLVEKYEIGWTGEEEKSLYQYLKKKEFEKGDILTTELFNLNENNEIKNFFVNRLIFPLHNSENELVGFSGRSLGNDEKTKFLISRETTLFRKSEILFNLTFVNQNFKAQKEIHLTEGFLDAIRLTEYKLPAVAILGTQLTKKQIELIQERYQKVIIVPDGDEAGKKSALKSAFNLIKNQLEVKIWNHNTNLDPDEFLKKNKEILQKKEKQLVTPINFIIANYPELNKENVLKKFQEEIILFLPFLTELEKHLFFKKMEEKYKIPRKISEKYWQIEKIKTNSKLEKPKNFLGENWELSLMFWALKFPRIISLMKRIPGKFATSKCNDMWLMVLKWNAEHSEKMFEKTEFLGKIVEQDILEWFNLFFEKTEQLIFLKSEEINENTLQDLLKQWHRKYLEKENEKLIKKFKTDGSKIPELEKLAKKINDRELNIIADYLKNEKNNSKI